MVERGKKRGVLAHPDIVSGATKLNMTQDFSHFALIGKKISKLVCKVFCPKGH